MEAIGKWKWKGMTVMRWRRRVRKCGGEERNTELEVEEKGGICILERRGGCEGE